MAFPERVIGAASRKDNAIGFANLALELMELSTTCIIAHGSTTFMIETNE